MLIITQVKVRVCRCKARSDEESCQHNEDSYQHNEKNCQHNDESCQHNEESYQHNDESSQRDQHETPFNIKDFTGADEELYQSVLEIRASERFKPEIINDVILRLCSERSLRPVDLAELLKRNVETIKNHYIGRLVRNGKLRPVLPEKTHPNQSYLAVKE